MNTLRISIVSIVACIASVGISNVNAASVAKMSLEKFVDVASPYWQVDVTCSDGGDLRAMHRPIESEAWCAADAKELCDNNKYTLSTKLCDDSLADNTVLASNTGKTQAATKSNLGSESTVATPDSSLGKTANKPNVSAAKKTTREALLSEQVQIEEQRILIGQKKLELRRQELALQKRQLNN